MAQVATRAGVAASRCLLRLDDPLGWVGALPGLDAACRRGGHREADCHTDQKNGRAIGYFARPARHRIPVSRPATTPRLPALSPSRPVRFASEI
jgi:hypothetical protein